jgi:hypothetical protein
MPDHLIFDHFTSTHLDEDGLRPLEGRPQPAASYPSPGQPPPGQPPPGQYPPGQYPQGLGGPSSPGAPPRGYPPGPPPTQPFGTSGPGGTGGPPPGSGQGSGPFGSRGRMILIIAGAVVLIGAAVAAGVVISRSGQPGGSTASPSVTSTRTSSPTPESATPSATPSGTPSESASATPTVTPAQTLPTSAAIPQEVVLVPMRRGGGSDRPLYLVDSEGTTDPVALPAAPGGNSNPMMQASRDTIIYLNNGVLRVMAADGSGDRSLFKNEPAGCAKVEHAAWNLADPNVVLISCKVSETKFALYVIGMDGRLIRRLDAGKSVIGDFGISPDGQTVVYWASNNPNRDGGSIFTLPIIGTGAPKQLTTSGDGVDADPAWSPDGSQIAFRRRVPNGTVNGNYDVFVMNADGSGVRSVAATPASDFKPIWSPDNKNLLIISDRKSTSGGPGKTVDLWLTRVSDGEVLTPLGLKAKQITRPFWTLR